MPCGPADILGKLAARNAFVNGESYCLMRGPGFTIEGGNVFDYLLIENGAAYLVFDIRDDPFGGMLFQYFTDHYSSKVWFSSRWCFHRTNSGRSNRF